jgi:DNA-binding protein H-NS
MDPYEELLARRDELEAQITAMRASRRPDVIAQIGRLMHEYEIGVEEITDWQGRQEEGGDRRRGRVAPRYLDPKTGATWSGRGKRPRWMGSRNPDEFLIRSGASASTSVVPTPQDELTRALYGTPHTAPKIRSGLQQDSEQDSEQDDEPEPEPAQARAQPARAAQSRNRQEASLTPGFPAPGNFAMHASKTLQAFQTSTIRRTK